ncbi:MAG: HD-GYP domain-containing protein [Thiobacillaceae bacterium]
MSLSEVRISVDQLREGLYIRLDTWMNHPFIFNSFKIRNAKQIEALRAAGIREVTCIPARSDSEPLPPVGAGSAPEKTVESATKTDPELAAMWREKQARRQKVAELRAAIAQCEQRFNKSVGSVKSLLKGLFAKPQESVGQAKALVSDMVDSLLTEKEVVIHLMSSKAGDENAYYHALNVTVLALLLAKEAGLSAEEMRDLGLGCLLHDIGKERVPSQILLKRTPWTAAEYHFYQQHVIYAVEAVQRLPNVTPGAMEVIALHHEMLDGSGFPARLTSERIGKLARIAAIVNAYDNHCNRVNPADSLTPAEALAHMFKHQREQFDPFLLKLFIRCMGVYPPGSIVQLNNDAIGLVVSVNPDRLLQPTILLYDAAIPREEAVFFELDEAPDLAIVKTLRPAELKPAVHEYLNPRARVNYFLEQGSDRK